MLPHIHSILENILEEASLGNSKKGGDADSSISRCLERILKSS
jgi:hypothetical protein